MLFNLYIEETLKELRDENIRRIKLNAILAWILRFLDGIAMITDGKYTVNKMPLNLDKTLKQ